MIQAEHLDRTTRTTYTGRRLITEFYQIHEYLVRNHLVYVHYGYYKQYVGLFIEGMLLSYASSEGLQGKVDFLTDDVLIVMLFYCSAEELKKFARWYDINDAPRAADGGQTIAHCIRFLERYPTFVTTVSTSEGTLPLRRLCEELLPNLLTVLATVQLAPQEISFIVQHLCTILRSPTIGFVRIRFAASIISCRAMATRSIRVFCSR